FVLLLLFSDTSVFTTQTYVHYGRISLVFIYDKLLQTCFACISDTGLLNISERHKTPFGFYASRIGWFACLNSPNLCPPVSTNEL
ncbi:hypothetical protein GYMLUDRAFT_614175, partial [Collybiopsis luxurians FD-317 M1]